MGTTKTFGRAEGNTNRIEKPDISDFHARITVLDDGQLLVEDRGIFKEVDSTNGTFVNGYRIRKATVSLNDEVRLSSDTVLDLQKIFALKPATTLHPKKDPKDFIQEFDLLEKVYNDYRAKKREIKQKHRQKSSLIRAGIMLAPLPVFYLISRIENVPPGMYLPLSVLGSVAGMYVAGGMSDQDALENLDEEFRVKYVCPNPACKMQLGMVPWKHYLNQGKCFRCNARYSKDAI